jgi:hypothetical protein
MYETPSPKELREFMAENRLTGADIAALAGVTPRSARRWVEPPDQRGARGIPWAAWVIIQILTGKIKKEDLVKKVDRWKKEKLGRGLLERGNAGRPPHGQ